MVLMTCQMKKMSTALWREHHFQIKCAPRYGESTISHTWRATGTHQGAKWSCILQVDTYVRRTVPRRESHEGGPSLVNKTRIAPGRGDAGKAPAEGLMLAAHGRAQQNEFEVHLDSAGDSFGAPARGGWRRRDCGVARK